MSDHLESLYIELNTSQECVVVGDIYLRPGTNFDLFVNDYRLILQNLGCRKSFTWGDFNLNLHHYDTSKAVKSVVDMYFKFSHLPLTNEPNRISGPSATAIDHIWHNHFTFPMESGVFMSDTSDHFSPFVIELSDESDIQSE